MGLGLAAKAKDALDVASQTTLALLLHLVIERWEGHMIKSEVKEQRFAGDRLKVRGELDQMGLLSDESGVKAEGLQVVTEGLHERSAKKPKTNKESETLSARRHHRTSCHESGITVVDAHILGG